IKFHDVTMKSDDGLDTCELMANIVKKIGSNDLVFVTKCYGHEWLRESRLSVKAYVVKTKPTYSKIINMITDGGLDTCLFAEQVLTEMSNDEMVFNTGCDGHDWLREADLTVTAINLTNIEN